MHPRARGQLAQAGAVEADAHESLVPALAGPAHEVDHSPGLVDPDDGANAPVPGREPLPELAVVGIVVQMVPAVGVAAQQEPGAVLEVIEVLEEADPGRVPLLEDGVLAPRRRVAVVEPDRVLAAVHPLDREGLAVGGPERPGDVVVGLRLEVHPDHLPVRHRRDADPDVRVRVACLRIALSLQLAVRSAGVVDRKDRDGRIVETHEGQARRVRRPPERGVLGSPPEDLLVVDPGGAPVEHGLASVGGVLVLDRRVQIVGVEVVVARVGHPLAVGRKARVLLARRRRGQAAEAPADCIVMIEVACALVDEAGQVGRRSRRRRGAQARRKVTLDLAVVAVDAGAAVGGADGEDLALPVRRVDPRLEVVVVVGPAADLRQRGEDPAFAGGCAAPRRARKYCLVGEAVLDGRLRRRELKAQQHGQRQANASDFEHRVTSGRGARRPVVMTPADRTFPRSDASVSALQAERRRSGPSVG